MAKAKSALRIVTTRRKSSLSESGLVYNHAATFINVSRILLYEFTVNEKLQTSTTYGTHIMLLQFHNDLIKDQMLP